MIDRELLDAFDDCINRLSAGQGVDDCLRLYPQYADSLAPMLMAGQLSQRAQFQPDEIAVSKDRVRFRFEQALNVSSAPSYRQFPLRRLLSFAASVMLIAAFLLGGAGALAQNSLPGDALYSLKLLTEDARLILSSDDDSLESQFNQRRIDETQELLDKGRAETVMFEGDIQTMNDTVWQIDSLMVQINAAQIDEAPLEFGMRVAVEAETTRDGLLIARRIRRLNDAPQRLPSPMPIRTSEPTRVPSATPTRRPTVTDTPQPVRPTSDRTFDAQNSSQNQIGVTPTATPTEQRCVISPPPDWIRYVIQSGDTLFDLAVRSGTTMERIQRVNCIDDPALIRVGQTIYLPASIQPTPTPTSTPPQRPVDRPTQTNDSNINDGGDNNGGRPPDGR
jgi:LysM repeat protein